MHQTNKINLKEFLKYSTDSALGLVYDLESKQFWLGNIDGETLNCTQIDLWDLEKFWDQKIFVYDSKTIFKLFSDSTKAPQFLDLIQAAYIENSNLSTKWEDFQERFSLKKFEKDDLEGKQICQDLWHTLELGQYFYKNLDKKLLDLWVDLESPLNRVLAEMEKVGIYIDEKKLQEIADELNLETNKLSSEIREILKTPNLNLDSPVQLGPALVNFGLTIKAKGSGKIPTDKETLESLLVQDQSGVVTKLLEYRTVTKLNSTYATSFLGKLDNKSRIHGIFNQVTAGTGRLSSSSPNLQNIPIRDPKYGSLLRSCIASSSENLLISADYSQIELRLLAHFCEDPTLIEAFEKDQDIHIRTASEIFEVELDKVTKEQRRVGKTLNFALLYQQGPQATGRQLGITTKEATSIIKKHFEKFPKIKPYLESTLDFARKNGYVETLFGRRRHFANINSTDGFLRSMEERAACNAPLQGSNADLLKQAMLNFQRAVETEKLPAKIILTIHDEILVEVEKSVAEKTKALLITEMELNQPLKVKIKVEAGIGQNWAIAK